MSRNEPGVLDLSVGLRWLTRDNASLSSCSLLISTGKGFFFALSKNGFQGHFRAFRYPKETFLLSGVGVIRTFDDQKHDTKEVRLCQIIDQE